MRASLASHSEVNDLISPAGHPPVAGKWNKTGSHLNSIIMAFFLQSHKFTDDGFYCLLNSLFVAVARKEERFRNTVLATISFSCFSLGIIQLLLLLLLFECTGVAFGTCYGIMCWLAGWKS